MISESPQPASTHIAKQHARFFRESGWIMLSTVVGGLMGAAVHVLSKKIPESEYSHFGALINVTALLPTIPLQMIFAQQTANALARNTERQLSGMIRMAWLWLAILWVLASGVVFLFQHQIMARWELESFTPVLITLFMVLMSLLMPMFTGVLQGKQDFFWIGWAAILAGVARLGFAALFVLALGAGSAGMIAGALIGALISAGICIWQSRDLWRLPSERFNAKSLFNQILPLAFGFGACQFLFTSDTLYATAYFNPDETAPYVSIGTLSRAVMWLVLPLAGVMFPKIVHSSVKAEKTNLFAVVLIGTAVLAVCGGVCLWALGPLGVRIIGQAAWAPEAKLLAPWYAAAMVPLALANVVANDLLARGKFRVVPAMVILALAYGFTLPYVLNHYPKKIEHVLQVLAAFNTLLLCVCGWAAFYKPKSARANNA